MATEIRRVWVTKYALTKGVYETEVRVLDGFSAGSAVDNDNRAYFHKGDWWGTRGEALAKAKTMQKAKIASLQRQIAVIAGKIFE